MAETFKIKIHSISEKNFFLNHELLPKTKEACETELNPGFGFKISVDDDDSLLIVDANAFYSTAEANVVASLEFEYSLCLENVSKFVKVGDNGSEIKIPENLMEVIVQEIYVTGRTLLNRRLKNTVLEDLYLPFNGASDLWKKLKNNGIAE